LGDVNERVKILENCGQKSLAYLTARTHGLDEEADRISESAFPEDSGLEPPQVNPNAHLLRPPVPISQQESNWPLLSVSKGFFEGNIAARTNAAAAGASAAAGVSPLTAIQTVNVDISAASKTWDEDANLEIDDEEGERVDRGDGEVVAGDDGEGKITTLIIILCAFLLYFILNA
jgi:coatomer protein complex subunit alpha (xenin)